MVYIVPASLYACISVYYMHIIILYRYYTMNISTYVIVSNMHVAFEQQSIQ